MKNIFEDNSMSIGRTPLVRLNRVTKDLHCTVAVKIEGRNPAYSVKCRVGAAIIWDAEEKGILVPGSRDVTVIEATSGNTGIGLAYVCAAKGYPLILAMPDTMSMERRRMLQAFGAQLILTDGAKGMKGAIARTREIVSKAPEKYLMANQFGNPANPDVHYKTTGPEILEDTGADVDIFVAGVGTGGTITGVARYLKEKKGQGVRAIAVEPVHIAVLSAIKRNQPFTPGPGVNKIQGIGAGFKPDILDMDLLDGVVTVGSDEAIDMAKRLHQEEGITCGISSGAAVAGALKVGGLPENKGKLIVTILPDAGERYLSSVLFENF
ncbi:cysteine synthase A [Desulfocicer vacuolatum DSM 3385]|uniref:Cysteine synthase n=1 Tax=Desulfocicer vacuolatum DSM 3385 TaxID=1121400 RepID=A0A1W2AX18_9BACT|nr:cysteine synthase A [Desulfocicer vacuolatum]SMC65080.1 cysteine synthase A [Desulfocicer vacuolatum DSM 3385]